jgi:hypothetical protein
MSPGAIVCDSASDAKAFLSIIDGAPKPLELEYIFGIAQNHKLHCGPVYTAVTIRNTVESVSLHEDDYDIVRVTYDKRDFYTFKRQPGERS